MKIAVVNPPSAEGIKFIREGRCEQRLSSFQYVMIPISIFSVGAVLRREGFEVTVIDCIGDDIGLTGLAEKLVGFDPGLVIFNFSTVTYGSDKAVVAELRKKMTAHFSAIGVHVTVLPDMSLSETGLDSVIRREPEITALELSKALRAGSDLSLVSGISYKSNGIIKHNPDRLFIEDLDGLPFPARDLAHNEKYTLPVINEPYTLLISSRGCPYKCVFCTAPLYYGSKLRLRSAKNIVDEIEEVLNKNKVRNITMWSDNFTLDKRFVKEICQMILDRGLKFTWMSNSRVDHVDLELLKLMKKAGCIGISYGVESGSQKILDNVKKSITVRQIEDAFRWTREAGIESLAHVILGLPGETEETALATIEFVKKIDPDYAQFYCAVPFPGTEYYELAKKNGWISDESFDRYELNQAVVNSPGLPAARLQKLRQKAYREFYFRPRYIFKRFLKLRSFRDFILTAKQAFVFFRDWISV